MSEDLERFDPLGPPLRRIALEHRSRYRFAEALAPTARALDLGCGEGYGTASMAQAGAGIAVGVEVSVETIARARRAYGPSGAAFVVGDAGALPFADGAFDLVVCFEVVEHLLRPRRLLEEARRVLRSGGAAVVSTPNRLANGTPSRFHVTEYSPEEYAELVRKTFPRARVVPQRSLALSEVESAGRDLDSADYLLAVEPPEAVEHAGAGRMAVRLAEVEREFQNLLDHYVDLVARVDSDRVNLRNRLGELEQQLAGVDADRGNLRRLLEQRTEQLGAVKADRAGVRERLTGVEADRANLGHLLSGAEADRANLRELLSEAEKDRVNLRQTLTGVEQDRGNLRELLAGVEADRRNLRELVAGIEEDRSNLRALLAETEAERERVRAFSAELEARLAAAGEEQHRLQGALEAVTRDLEAVLGSRSWRLLRALGIVRR